MSEFSLCASESSIPVKLTQSDEIICTFDLDKNHTQKIAFIRQLTEVCEERSRVSVNLDSATDINIILKGGVHNLSCVQKHVSKYLKKRKIFELFNLIIAHLACERPDNPIAFIAQLLDRCMLFRREFEGWMGPPFLFSSDHIKALYKAFDPLDRGSITLSQYRTGMLTLGINSCLDTCPKLNEEGRVDQAVFCAAAKINLATNLLEMVKIHRKPDQQQAVD